MFGIYARQEAVLRREAEIFLTFMPVPYGLPCTSQDSTDFFAESAGRYKKQGCLPHLVMLAAVATLLVAVIGWGLGEFPIVVPAMSVGLAVIAFIALGRFTPPERFVPRNLTLEHIARDAVLHRNVLGAVDPLHVWCSFDQASFGRHEVELTDEQRASDWNGFALIVTLEGQHFPLAVKPTTAELDAYLASLPERVRALPWTTGPLIAKRALFAARAIMESRP